MLSIFKKYFETYWKMLPSSQNPALIVPKNKPDRAGLRAHGSSRPLPPDQLMDSTNFIQFQNECIDSVTKCSDELARSASASISGLGAGTSIRCIYSVWYAMSPDV